MWLCNDKSIWESAAIALKRIMLDFLYVDKMLMYVEEVARVLDYQGQDQLICSQLGEDIYLFFVIDL